MAESVRPPKSNRISEARKRDGQPSLLFLKKAVIALAENKSTGKRLADDGKAVKKTSPVTDLFYWAEALVFALTFLVLLSVFFCPVFRRRRQFDAADTG